MNVIVPLAGPDFVRADGSIKALELFQGQPLLKFALDSRPWNCKVRRYSFVLHDCEETRRFAHDFLSHWFVEYSVTYLSSFTRGAAISTLAGLSLLDDFCQPLIIDLADIIYKSNVNIQQEFEKDFSVGGIALTFESRDPQYSYLATDKDGRTVGAVEKRVISDQASVGTYIFRDYATVLKAMAHAIENEPNQTHNNLFYVCPLFNGVIAQGGQVTLVRAFDILDIKVIGSSHGRPE